MDECSVEMNILWRDWENPLLEFFLREETKRAVLTNLIPALDDSPPLKGRSSPPAMALTFEHLLRMASQGGPNGEGQTMLGM